MAKAVKGIKELEANIRKEINATGQVTLAGLLEFGLLVEGEAKRRVPVEENKLRASGYSRKAQNHPMGVEVGFTAGHAAAVHELVDMKLKGKPRRSGTGVYWGPAGEARFLANAVTNKTPELPAVMKKNWKRKRGAAK